MEIELINITLKKEEKTIFEDLNLKIPCNKIIGLYGNKYQEFIDLLINKNIETGKIIDNNYLNRIDLIDNYDNFITNLVSDELYINLGNYKEKTVLKYLEKFDLDINFLNRPISSLSNCERKIVKLIISILSKNKTLILINLFLGLDYKYKKILINMLKDVKKEFDKIIFIHDNDMDIVEKVIDKLLIVDSNLVAINYLDKIFKMEEIKKIDINWPSFIKLKHLLSEKGFDVLKINNINKLIKEVSRNV